MGLLLMICPHHLGHTYDLLENTEIISLSKLIQFVTIMLYIYVFLQLLIKSILQGWGMDFSVKFITIFLAHDYLCKYCYVDIHKLRNYLKVGSRAIEIINVINYLSPFISLL